MEFPNLKVKRVRNARGDEVTHYRHAITGRNYGTDRDQPLKLWAADQKTLVGPTGRARKAGTVAAALQAFRESAAFKTIAERV